MFRIADAHGLEIGVDHDGGRGWWCASSGSGGGGAKALWRGGQEGVAGVSGAVAQAMRDAGCLNRRSLGVNDVFPRLPIACLGFFGWAPQGTLGAHCGPAPGAGARLARPAGRRSLRFVCPLSPLGAGNTTCPPCP